MLRQIERILKLDMLLRSGQRKTAASLAEALEVSKLPNTRAMRRVQALSQSLAAPEDS
ncbi:putative DNA-binding transcriptional regulator YafY [Thermostichus sp. MS-CIW-19]